MSGIQKLLETTARLRAPDGCPWDRAQNHQSICDCLVEEVAEVLEAIDRKDMSNLREELGDLLFHVALHAQMAAEAGHFTFNDVAEEVNEKMVRRHPHVFGSGQKLGSADAVVQQWEQIKAREKGAAAPTLFKQLPKSLDALLVARELWKQIQKKQLTVGSVVNKESIAREAKDLDEQKAGEKLFRLVAACRDAGIDPDSALRRFTSRVKENAEGLNASS
jgi:XTP/dITP diphosphohydrolase/tetrapyrrole methylase family protein/MazG family protein